MRIFLALLLPLAVAAGVESEHGNLPPPAVNTDSSASVLLVANDGGIDKDSRLRGTQALETAISSLQQDPGLQEIPDVIDFAELSSVERIEKVEELQSKLNVWVSKLTEVEMLAVTNGVMEFSSIIRNAQAGLQKLNKPVAKMVELLELAEDETQDEDTLEEEDMRRLVAVTPQNLATKQNKRAKTTYEKRKEHHKRYRRSFDEQRQRAKTFHQSHFHNKMADLQEAIFNGDHGAIKHFSNSVLESHYARYGRRGGASANPGQRRLDKASMCYQLTDCAKKMSKYDMFAYFYSDDIDSTTGEIDDTVVKYDEEDLDKKYDKIKKLAAEATDDKGCDALLQQFHRTKENGNVPSWEGGTVGQVCIAEGTTLFVKLEDAAKTLLIKPEKLISKASSAKHDLAKGDSSELKKELDAIFKKTTAGYSQLVKTLVLEPIACAQSMWGGKDKKEPFPFGEGGKLLELDEEKIRTVETKQVDGMMEKARFPTFKDESSFPKNANAKEVWKRKLGNLKANYKITMKDIWLRTNGDSGSEAEIYGDCWVEVGGKKKETFWSRKSNNYQSIRGGARYYVNEAKKFDNVDTVNTLIEVKCHLKEEDDWGDDDFGTKGHAVTVADEFYLKFVDGGTDCRVNFKVERDDINNGVEKIEGDARDEFGQIQNNQKSPYSSFVPYKYLTNRYQLCSQKLAASVLKDLTKKEKDGEDYDVRTTLDTDFYEKFYKDCLGGFFGAMREGIDLVFGDRTSTGFICGMKEAVVKGGKDLPGTCCLDAPYELEGDDWGQEYQCPKLGETSKCKKEGPFFSGMSTQACDSYGGKWCANEVDCSELQKCIKKDLDLSKKKNPAYYDYLDSAPKITDTKSFKQCGATRVYFGFDKYFSNDAQVCEDIRQLEQMNDFDFINDFYGTGGDSDEPAEKPKEIDNAEFEDAKTSTVAPAEVAEVPEAPEGIEPETEEPDYAFSDSEIVQKGMEWFNTIFAQEQVLESSQSALDFAENVACPDLPFVGTYPCELVKSVVKAVLLVVIKVTGALVKISNFMKTSKTEVDNVKPARQIEQVEAVTNNVQVTAETVTQAADKINGYIHDTVAVIVQDVYDKNKITTDYLADLDKGQKETIKEYFESLDDHLKKVGDQESETLYKIRKDIEDVEGNYLKKIIPSISFDMQATVLSKESKSFVVVTTGSDGKPTKPDFFTIKGVAGTDATIVSETDYKSKKLGSVGEQVITLVKSVKANVFIVSAGLYEGRTDNELVTKTALLSFL